MALERIVHPDAHSAFTDQMVTDYLISEGEVLLVTPPQVRFFLIPNYSWRKTIMGSTALARRAGT
jgi:hypothetical protein